MDESTTAFVADEGFNRGKVRGIQSRKPGVSILRAQEVELSGAADPDILEWAAQSGRVVLTHDKSTMRADAIVRLNAGLPMPGVVAVHQDTPTGMGVQGLLEMIGGSLD